jgi:hypothetical protein
LVFIRQMETYAGFMEQTDHHFGRIVDYIDEIGELDNTLIIVISDNGPSAEGGVNGTYNEMLFFNQIEEELEDNLAHYDGWGGPDTFPHYSWGWTNAGATPFRRWKRETYRGGTSDPCIISWPERITSGGELRPQYCLAIDIVPTILAAIGAEPPTSVRGVPQSEIQGVSFAHTFSDAGAESKRTTQYFEMFGHRAIYHEGWRAVCPFPGPSFAEAAEEGRYFGSPLTADVLADLDATRWELYNVADDPSEIHNVAEADPDKLREMIDLWYAEAERFDVLPLATGDLARMNTPRPTIARPRQRFVYQTGGAEIPYTAAPRVYNRSHSITAEVDIPESGGDGVLLACGNRHGGYTFFMKDGHLHHVHNYVGREWFKVRSADPIAAGAASLRFEFEVTGEPDFANGKGTPGRSQLYVNGQLVADVELPYTVPNVFSIAGLSCGRDLTDSVSPEDYASPGDFNGEIKSVTLDVTGDVIVDDEAELKRLMTQQ